MTTRQTASKPPHNATNHTGSAGTDVNGRCDANEGKVHSTNIRDVGSCIRCSQVRIANTIVLHRRNAGNETLQVTTEDEQDTPKTVPAETSRSPMREVGDEWENSWASDYQRGHRRLRGRFRASNSSAARSHPARRSEKHTDELNACQTSKGSSHTLTTKNPNEGTIKLRIGGETTTPVNSEVDFGYKSI